MIKLSPAAIESLRSAIKLSCVASIDASWAFAEHLCMVKNFLTEGNQFIYEAWGFASFADYVRTELGHPEDTCHSSHANTYMKFCVTVTNPRLRTYAKSLPIYKLASIHRVVTNANAESWLNFAAAHNVAECKTACRVVKEVPSLSSNPEGAIARAERSSGRTGNALNIPMNRTNAALAASAANLVRRVMNDNSVSKEKVEHLMLLVREGRAGDGWNMDRS